MEKINTQEKKREFDRSFEGEEGKIILSKEIKKLLDEIEEFENGINTTIGDGTSEFSKKFIPVQTECSKIKRKIEGLANAPASDLTEEDSFAFEDVQEELAGIGLKFDRLIK